MISVKKIISTAAIAVLSVSLFALPKSLTGLVEDVDNYMDVNSWSDVEFNKYFGFMGYNDPNGLAANDFNAGLATRIGKLYTGFFFAGNLAGSHTKTVTGTSTTTVGDTTYNANGKTSTTEGTDSHTFELASLIGLGNFSAGNIALNGLAVRPSIRYKANDDNTTWESGKVVNELTKDDYTYKDNKNNWSLTPAVAVGFNTELGGLKLTPRGEFSLGLNVNNTKYEKKGTESDASVSTNNTSSYTNTVVSLSFGTGLELPKAEDSIATTSFDFDVGLSINNPTSKTHNYSKTASTETTNDTKTNRHGTKYVSVSSGWTTTVKPNEKLGIVFKGELPVWMSFSNNESKITSSNTINGTTTDTVYYANNATTKNSSVSIYPNLYASLSYKATNKLTFKVGADVTLPYWTLSSNKVTTYDSTAEERKETNTTKTTNSYFTAPDNDFSLTWESGFRFDLTENVAFDCDWNIVGDLFTNFSQTPSLKNSSFWDGMGKICFHDLSFLVSVKF